MRLMKYFRSAVILMFLLSGFPAFGQKGKPWWEAGQPRWAKSDLGGVFSATIDLRGAKPSTVFKAIAVSLGDQKNRVTAVFDTEMLSLVTAVPEYGVMFNTYRDGLGGSGHWLGAPYLFNNLPGPGWAMGKSFEDSREDKFGPLPGKHAKYLGLYRNGQDVIFSYTVGGIGILENFEAGTGGKSLRRYIEIDAAGEEMMLSLGTAATVAKIVAAAGGAEIVEIDGRKVLKIPAHAKPMRLQLILGADAPEGQARDLKAMTKGGEARYPQPLVTKGELGNGTGAYVVDTITPPFENPGNVLFRFGGHDFFSTGDAAVCTMDGDVWVVSGIDGKLEKLSWRRFATGLFQPLGLRIVKDKVYVLGRDQITRLHDLNDDGEADFYECFNNGCKIGKHVHEFSTGLDTDPQGNFYFVKGHGGKNKHAGTFLKVSADGASITPVATGFRWPNGSGVGPKGQRTVADQQGGWVPSSRLDLIKDGGFYGFMGTHHREVAPTTYDGPLCWIPHKVDNSCGGQSWVEGGKWGPFEGMMVHTSYGKCRLFMVLAENIDGVDQAGVVQFPGVKFQSGAMRARFSPHDGQLYVSGLKGWQTSGAKDGCFQRIRFTGKPVRMPTALNIHTNGIRIMFSEKLDRELAEDLDSWQLERWNYRWAGQYGSKDWSVADPNKQGRDKLVVASARLLPGDQGVFLEVADMQKVMQMGISYDLEDTDGEEIIGAIYNTVHTMAPAFKP